MILNLKFSVKEMSVGQENEINRQWAINTKAW
jgi:hypothetical protein